jgi:hypothetical protein
MSTLFPENVHDLEVKLFLDNFYKILQYVEALSSAEALVVLVGYDYDEIHFTTLYFT